MSKQRLLKLLLELTLYEMGNDGMFDGHFDNTIWEKTHGRSQKTHEKLVSELSEDEAHKQFESILDTLVQYDCEKTGMFDFILVDNGRKENKRAE